MNQENLEQDPQPEVVEQHNNHRTLIYVVLAIFVTAVSVGLASYYFFRIIPSVLTPGNPQLGNQTNLENQDKPDPVKQVYFGKGFGGKNSLVNVDTGESKQFIPSGYKVLKPNSYQQFPSYLILQKDDSIYSYNVENEIINNVFISGIKIRSNQDVRIYPSITEKDKFIIRVDLLDLTEVSELYGTSPVVSSQAYSFDASQNKTQSIVLEDILDCGEFDSKNQRFFSWICGEGIGSATPLTIFDMSGKKVQDIITSSDFGLVGDDTAKVLYSNGHFFAIDNEKSFKVIAIDASLTKPIKEVYTLDSNVTLKPGELSAYSLAIDRSTSTIILGSSHHILLLPFNEKKKIVKAVYIPDAEIYANFIFVNEGKLYYLAKNIIRIINLKAGKLEKSITTPNSHDEISLFAL